jgi:hypothetical protein
MGLLDDLPYGLLNLIRNGTQSRTPNGDFSADDANGFPSRVPQQQQRLPLSFAGPDLTADITAASPSRPNSAFLSPRPNNGPAATDPSWLLGDRPADARRVQPPTQTAQNLTAQVLRMRGVPEASITAAIGNPELMKSLITQHYGPGFAGTPGLLRAEANKSVQFDGSTRFFAAAGPRSGPSGLQGSSLVQPVNFECQGYPAGCQSGGDYGTNATHYAGGRDLCRKCAIRYLGLQDEPNIRQIENLRGWERK